MHLCPRLLSALLVLMLLLAPAVLRADDGETSATKSDKTEEKTVPREVTPPGSIAPVAVGDFIVECAGCCPN